MGCFPSPKKRDFWPWHKWSPLNSCDSLKRVLRRFGGFVSRVPKLHGRGSQRPGFQMIHGEKPRGNKNSNGQSPCRRMIGVSFITETKRIGNLGSMKPSGSWSKSQCLIFLFKGELGVPLTGVVFIGLHLQILGGNPQIPTNYIGLILRDFTLGSGYIQLPIPWKHRIDQSHDGSMGIEKAIYKPWNPYIYNK